MYDQSVGIFGYVRTAKVGQPGKCYLVPSLTIFHLIHKLQEKNVVKNIQYVPNYQDLNYCDPCNMGNYKIGKNF